MTRLKITLKGKRSGFTGDLAGTYFKNGVAVVEVKRAAGIRHIFRFYASEIEELGTVEPVEETVSEDFVDPVQDILGDMGPEDAESSEDSEDEGPSEPAKPDKPAKGKGSK